MITGVDFQFYQRGAYVIHVKWLVKMCEKKYLHAPIKNHCLLQGFYFKAQVITFYSIQKNIGLNKVAYCSKQ